MASSFVEQIPVVIPALKRLAPKTVLDIGKGFGKYAFLIHEYLGVRENTLPDPTLPLKDQSGVAVDAVEIQPAYMWPHIDQFYRDVHLGDITRIYDTLHGYDVVLMLDVIEHLEREPALAVVKHFIDDGSVLMISSPRVFFHQDIYGSEWESHRSHWKPGDFAFAPHLDWQASSEGRIYVLANRPCRIKGFGHRPAQRLRRFARLAQDVAR